MMFSFEVIFIYLDNRILVRNSNLFQINIGKKLQYQYSNFEFNGSQNVKNESYSTFNAESHFILAFSQKKLAETVTYSSF